VGLRAGLDVCEKSRPYRDSIPGPFSPQPVAIPTELPGNYSVTMVIKCRNVFDDSRNVGSCQKVLKTTL
jgi:hypothetical protein